MTLRKKPPMELFTKTDHPVLEPMEPKPEGMLPGTEAMPGAEAPPMVDAPDDLMHGVGEDGP